MAQRRVEVTVSVIVHATEDSDVILNAISEMEIKNDAFESTKTTGHFNNTITIYDAKVKGRDARRFVQKLSDMLSAEDMNALIGQIHERAVNSGLHIRIDKQILIRDRRIEIINLYDTDHLRQNGGGVKDVIKIKIHTPIYSKKDTRLSFEEVLRADNAAGSSAI